MVPRGTMVPFLALPHSPWEPDMDRKHLPWIVAVIVALVVVWQFASAQGERERAMQKWEYKTVLCEYEKAEKSLNDAGSEGWELVTMISSQTIGGNKMLVLKRPKP
jgi:hypothetical protein